MSTVLIVIIGILIIGIILFAVSFLMRRKIGVPQGEVVYSDSDKTPGEVLEAHSIPLVGKPDFILLKDGVHVPVEIKTGKTPKLPYKNHVAQLFAYCLLIGEHFGKRPEYGIIRYPEREIPLEYSEAAEEGVKKTIYEVLQKKQSGDYRSSLKQVCKNCREGKHASDL